MNPLATLWLLAMVAALTITAGKGLSNVAHIVVEYER